MEQPRIYILAKFNTLTENSNHRKKKLSACNSNNILRICIDNTQIANCGFTGKLHFVSSVVK